MQRLRTRLEKAPRDPQTGMIQLSEKLRLRIVRTIEIAAGCTSNQYIQDDLQAIAELLFPDELAHDDQGSPLHHPQGSVDG